MITMDTIPGIARIKEVVGELEYVDNANVVKVTNEKMIANRNRSPFFDLTLFCHLWTWYYC